MDEPFFNQFDKGFEIHDESGNVVLKVGFILTLYLKDGYREERQQLIADCISKYLNVCHQHLNWATLPDSKRWVRFKKSRFISPSQWLQDMQPGEDDSWQFIYHGGEKKESSSSFCVQAFSPGKWREDMGKLSFLSIYFPINWFVNREDSFGQWVLDWSSKLNPYHGYASIGVHESFDQVEAELQEKTVFGLAKRFPGLDVDHPVEHSMYLNKGIKGVNWFTILNDYWLDQFQIRKRLSELPDGFEVTEYAGGAMIQSGSLPELGDRNRQIMLKNYPVLAKILKDIRYKEHDAMHFSGGLNTEQTRLWLARFEDGDLW